MQVQIGLYIRTLASMLRARVVEVLELAPWVPLLTTDVGSDGLHLGPRLQQDVFGRMLHEIQQVIPRLVLPAPVRELTVCTRWQLRQHRGRQRTLRWGGEGFHDFCSIGTFGVANS